MNKRKEKAIALVSLVITIILLLIIAGISINGAIRGKDKTQDTAYLVQLNMVQHTLLERYTKSQLTKEELPGNDISKEDVQSIIDEINSKTEKTITLKGNNYKELNKEDLEELGIYREENTYIVCYETGEVINKTKQVTNAGDVLYIYSTEE